MLMIRFQRTGRTNDPSFRIVVTEKTASPKAGKNVALVGSYDPKTKKIVIDAEAVKEWLGKGAKASGTVHNLLISQGIIEGKKVNVLQKKSVSTKDEGPEAQAPAPGAAPDKNINERRPAETSSDKPQEAPPTNASKESEAPAQ